MPCARPFRCCDGFTLPPPRRSGQRTQSAPSRDVGFLDLPWHPRMTCHSNYCPFFQTCQEIASRLNTVRGDRILRYDHCLLENVRYQGSHFVPHDRTRRSAGAFNRTDTLRSVDPAREYGAGNNRSSERGSMAPRPASSHPTVLLWQGLSVETPGDAL